MDGQDLANILKEMYTRGLAEKRAVAMIHLFGIMYAGAIAECNASAREIAQKAGISESYGTEIAKGCVLAEFVTVHDGSVLKWRA